MVIKKFVFWLVLLVSVLYVAPGASYAAESMTFFDITKNAVTPIPCGTSESRSCPKEMTPIYEKLGEPCSKSFQEFSRFPSTRHFWIEDPAITAQGKANERARQFIYFAINSRAIDDHPVLREIWGITSTVAFFFVVIVAAIFGLGFIISKRTNFDLNIELWPTLIKLGVMLLYIALSASIVLLLIQLSEILMRFFIDNMGGKDLFTIYFTSAGNLGTTERNYTDFVGCRDLNIRVQESVDAKMFIYKMTNITYYIMGTMIILRKILLWFLLFVAPFLALLMPFVFIRNIGWIWIGVFFQWLMYGPLFALFLGALSKIWKAGIPFTFDFSRVIPVDKFQNATNPLIGYTYPTAINILYGGPAQIGDRRLSAVNSGSYVDTFAEYVITLIMLWAVTFFPWWLLRIFRDYCCDGIYAMKNVLFSMYEDARSAKGKPTGPTPKFDLKQVLRIPEKQDVSNKISVKIANMEQIKKMATQDISKSLNIRATKLTDIAQMEANQVQKSAVQKNLAMLANPATATAGAERSQFMNMRTELFNRAIKQDSMARTLLSSTSASSYERNKVREELLKSINNNVSVKTTATISAEQMNQLGRSMSASQKSSAGASSSSTVTLSDSAISSISRSSDMSADKTKEVLQAYAKTNASSMNKAISALSKQLNVSTSQVRSAIEASMSHQAQKTNSIMTTYLGRIANSEKMVAKIAEKTRMSNQQIKDILAAYTQSMDKPANQVVPNITVIAKVEEKQVKGALQMMSTMFASRELVLDFAEDNKVEVDAVNAAISKTAAAGGTGDTPEVGGPGSGGPMQPTKTEAELQEAGKGGTPGKAVGAASGEAEAGADQGLGGGPSPAPTEAERKMAAEVAEKAMQDEAIREQAGLRENDKPEDRPVIVRSVLRVISDNTEAANEVVKEVAEKEQVKENEAANIVQEQINITTNPEQNIEKIVAVPPSVTIEEYEELKDMWEHQYEEGEIPVQENIQTREEWVEQDIVTITNVMNKILSPNEEIQQQGLDELGYIIPIFMINNLKGDQLITYLKAKLEAAKLVKKILDRENAIKKKMSKEKDDEELVELKTEKKDEQANQPMHMELDEDKGPTTIEERAQVEVQAAPEINKAYEESSTDEYGTPNPLIADNSEASAEESSQGSERSWDDQASQSEPQLKEYGEEDTPKEFGSEESVMNKLKEYGEDEDKT